MSQFSRTNNQRSPRVAVVGSLVMDMVFRVKRRPRPGETVFGESFELCPGGKGFNQAVAARRAGADVIFVGRTGSDSFGDDFRAFLATQGIAHDFVARDEDEGTAVACPVVDETGENAIVAVPRANMRLAPTDVERAATSLESAQVLLLQHEVPVAASIAAARIVKGAGGVVVLNPAPAAMLDPALLEHVDILVPNEVEIETAVGRRGDPVGGALQLHEDLRVTVILTRGARGVLAIDERGWWGVPAFSVQCVDSTGAGDAFCGALAVALAEGRSLRDAVDFANAAGAISVTRAGSGPTMPTREEIETLVESRLV